MTLVRSATIALALFACCLPATARTPSTLRRIALEPLDFQPLPAQVLGSGASILTLHYVDPGHLLVTFSRRRLMKRIVGNPATDSDRNIDAVLLDIASSKVLARTSWQLHDAGQYLWSLGGGDFLLRQRDRLTVVSPLAELAAGRSFTERAFIVSSRPIGAVLLSPGKDLLTLETLDRSPYLPKERKPSPGTSAYAAAAAAGDQAAEQSPGHVQIDFFRLNRGQSGEVQPKKVGVVGVRNMVLLPIDTSGYLSLVNEGRSHWAFNYNRHGGQVDELSPFDSTCQPIPFLVSRSEFVAFGCRSGQDPKVLGGFNLRGEEMWEQTFTDTFTSPTFSFAPVSGRFAMSRLVTSLPLAEDLLVAEQLQAQNITVYQIESGRQIFSMNCNPILRASQNFAISPDGQELAVINNGAIEFYPLPTPSARDRDALHMAETLTPAPTEAMIHLSSSGASKTAAAEEAREAQTPAAGATLAGTIPAATAAPDGSVSQPKRVPAAQSAPSDQTQLGDAPVEPVGHRKAPTLYGPGEKTGSSPATDPSHSR